MALDTANKRFSMMDFGSPAPDVPLPEGSFTDPDWFHLLGLYAQDVGTGPPPPPEGADWLVTIARRRRR